MREALLEVGDDGLVIVTHLDESALGQDLVARFAKRRLYPIDGWTILKDVFQAREIDPSLLRRPWLADAVVEKLPFEGVQPVPAGVLDAETVWGIVLRRQLKFRSSKPDDLELLLWSLDKGSLASYFALSDELRGGVREWITECAGKSVLGMFSCIDSGCGSDCFPVGLALKVVSSDSTQPSLKGAAARLERFTGQIPFESANGWADAAGRLFDHLDLGGNEQQILAAVDRSDQILKEIQAAPFASFSDYSRLGFDMRLEGFGKALRAGLDVAVPALAESLLERADAVRSHRWAARYPWRTNQVDMAIRLMSWLAMVPSSDKQNGIESFEQIANDYARDGGFVDWARQTLFFGDPLQTLSTAYGRLCDVVTQRRESQSKIFAQRMADWIAAGADAREVILVEDILKSVVAPLARSAPVLLLVVDGMSFAVFRELIQDISAQGWLELNKKGASTPKPAIAALPSITEVCRRSLFAGRLMTGSGEDEKQAFFSQAELLKVSKSGGYPVLFQKSDLTEPGGASLAVEVRQEIASTKRRIVAAVVNAVDDHLLKGDQVSIPWTLSHIPMLNQLLGAAMDAGRLVVLTSDHGHVLDHDTDYRPSTLGERYRSDQEAIHADEVRIAGPRVVVPTHGALIAPWSEKVRYGGKRNGYHGGASPQECVIPLAVLGWQTLIPEDYEPVALYRPDWWLAETAARRAPLVEPAVVPISEPQYQPEGQAKLPFVASGTQGTWIDRLLRSPLLGRQLQQAGRGAPSLDKLRCFLQTLDERGGTLLRAALAQKLGEPELRMPGLIAAVRRVLNVDGYPVLSVDDTSGSVMLNRQLVEVQFELARIEESNG
jgi:hypothetical protein